MENLVIMMTLFAIVIVGYIAGKTGYMGGDFDRRLSNIIIDITCPALILSSTMSGTLPHRDMILPLLLIIKRSTLCVVGKDPFFKERIFQFKMVRIDDITTLLQTFKGAINGAGAMVT